MSGSRIDLSRWARWTLAGFLAVTGVLKMLSGHAEHLQTSEFVYVAAWSVELLLSGLLVSRWSSLGAVGAVALGVAGVSHALLFRPTSCGCAGTWWVTSWRFELVLASVAGMLAVLSLPRVVTIRS
jgi:hypothetical protein